MGSWIVVAVVASCCCGEGVAGVVVVVAIVVGFVAVAFGERMGSSEPFVRRMS